MNISEEDVTRNAIVEHFRARGIDEKAASAMYCDNAVLEFVQSGEQIVGKANIVASREAYPGRPVTFEVVRVTGSGDLWVAELILRFGGAEPHYVAAVLDLDDRHIDRERIYIAEPWDPPAYRAAWATVTPPSESS